MKKILFFISLMVMVACSSELDEVVSNGEVDSKTEFRLSFKNSQDLLDTYFKLTEMNSTDFENWIQNNNPAFLLEGESEDDSFNRIPRSFQALFNSNLELNIQDTIVYYNKGNLYILSVNGDEAEVGKNKSNLSSCTILGSAETVSLNLNSSNLKNSWSGVNGLGPNYQVPFNYGDGRYQYKYIYEIETFKYRFDMRSICYDINFVNKMEYKYKKWDQAGEWRTVSTSINGTITAEITNRWGAVLKQDFNIINNTKAQQMQYKTYILLARTIKQEQDTSYELASSLTGWTFNLNCNITQEVTGVPSTRKTTSFGW